jgi:hypothetical protein
MSKENVARGGIRRGEARLIGEPDGPELHGRWDGVKRVRAVDLLSEIRALRQDLADINRAINVNQRGPLQIAD